MNATHTSVPVNTFFISNGVEMSRGSTGRGDYSGTTSTTYNTNKTYTGEYVQIDMGQNILMTECHLHVPSIAPSNPKSWKLLYSGNGTDWTEAHDISANTSWENSRLISTSSYGSGKQFDTSTLSNDFIGRYFRLVVNKITGAYNHVKIGEIQIKGVMHTLETVSDNNPSPGAAATATPSDNTTTDTDSTVTSTTHLNNDTTTTTTTETRIVVSANTETTTTKKKNIQIVTTATPHFGLTATASNVVTTHSDNTVTSTTYGNNDTTTRTLVTKTVDISANTNTSTNYNTIITKIINAFAISTGSSSAFDPNKIFDASGVACPALKSIYEQLMNISGRSQIMKSRDFTSSPMPSVGTITGGFPFIAGDKLVMYIRPKIVFAQATFPEQFTSITGFGGVTFGEPAVDTALASGGAISGQTYTESSKYSDTYAGSKLFDGSTTSFWITASDTYNSSTGIAEGGSTTIHADDGGGTYTGHYVQIEFANSVAIEDIKITPRNLGGGGAGEPKEFRILSSDDGSTFRVAYSVAEGDLNNDWSLWSTQTYHLPNLRNASSKGKYWRIAIGKITTGNKVQLAKVELIGNLTSSLIGNEVGQPVTTGGQGMVDPYDVASINSTLSGQTYTDSTNYRADFAGSFAFNDVNNENNAWLSANGTYLESGVYNASESTNGYTGEWVQVDIGQNIILQSYEIHSRATPSNNNADDRNAEKMRLFYSSDGTNWTQLRDWTGLTVANDWGGIGNYTPVGPYTSSVEGRYFRLVINKAIGTSNKQFAQVGELRLKGITLSDKAINDAVNDPVTTTYPTSTLTNGYPTTGSILDISGLETNITKLSSTFPVLFPGKTTGGNEAEPEKFGWVGSANADSLSLETTDETDTRTMDLHIWKITITL
ncbi:MAG: hypothetical protein CMP10_21995 [Zetaproteobacteria bacterium]|nr:hypothetical protein [Pseudobdellovibrionaceae bacterium]